MYDEHFKKLTKLFFVLYVFSVFLNINKSYKKHMRDVNMTKPHDYWVGPLPAPNKRAKLLSGINLEGYLLLILFYFEWRIGQSFQSDLKSDCGRARCT